MAKVFDTRNSDGAMVVLGDYIVLPNGANESNAVPGSIRYNNDTNALEIFSPSTNQPASWQPLATVAQISGSTNTSSGTTGGGTGSNTGSSENTDNVFISSGIPCSLISTSNTITIPHNLNKIPTNFGVYVKNVIPEHGYNINDTASPASSIYMMYADINNLYYMYPTTSTYDGPVVTASDGTESITPENSANPAYWQSQQNAEIYPQICSLTSTISSYYQGGYGYSFIKESNYGYFITLANWNFIFWAQS